MTNRSWRLKIRETLKWSKVFRLHATFHAAMGYLKTHLKTGPEYFYMVPFLNSKLNFFVGLYNRSRILLFSEIVTTIPINESVNQYFLNTKKISCTLMTDHNNHAADFIFDNNNQEQPPWKTCGRTCSRTAFFSIFQCLVVLILLLLSIINFIIDRTCDERTVWIAILSSVQCCRLYDS